MLAFFAEQIALYSEGVVPIYLAARLCAVHRETLLHAVATGRMRSRQSVSHCSTVSFAVFTHPKGCPEAAVH